jgi:calcium-dependent protein kinase
LAQDDEKKDLDNIFKAIDKDGNGNLDKEEVKEGWELHFGVQMTDKEIDEMFAKIDIDGNGTIDYTEFVMATMEESTMVTNDRLKAAFNMFDTDHSGALSPEEIKEVLCFNSNVEP